jgi:hypothetical protein
MVFGLSGSATFGVYLGKSLQNEGMGRVALKSFANHISRYGIAPGGLAMQLCEPGRDGDHIFGAIAMVNGTFKSVQDAMNSWSNAQCIGGFSSVTNLTTPIFVTAPPLVPITNSTTVSLYTLDTTAVGVARSLYHGPRLNIRAACRTI